jgi:hypothetical protein
MGVDEILRNFLRCSFRVVVTRILQRADDSVSQECGIKTVESLVEDIAATTYVLIRNQGSVGLEPGLKIMGGP